MSLGSSDGATIPIIAGHAWRRSRMPLSSSEFAVMLLCAIPRECRRMTWRASRKPRPNDLLEGQVVRLEVEAKSRVVRRYSENRNRNPV